MAARDRYSFDVKCPHCDTTAVFDVSEDDFPFMRNPHRSVDKVEGNMTGWVVRGVEWWGRCGACKVDFKIPVL
jgi:hypothetical protein